MLGRGTRRRRGSEAPQARRLPRGAARDRRGTAGTGHARQSRSPRPVRRGDGGCSRRRCACWWCCRSPGSWCSPLPIARATSRSPTFVTLFTDPVFVEPLHDHARHRHLGQPHLLPRRRAHGLDRGAHRHALRPRHPHAGDGLVRDAAVPRRHRLGAAGRAQQRPPQPALPRGHRRRPGCGAVQHLHAARPDLRHLLLHLPLRVRAGRQCARPHSRRPRGRLRHAGRQRLAHGAAGDDPAGAAGAGRGRARCLPAGDDAVRLAGDPGAACRLPHHDDQDLEPVPVPAQAGAGRRRRPAAAAC